MWFERGMVGEFELWKEKKRRRWEKVVHQKKRCSERKKRKKKNEWKEKSLVHRLVDWIEEEKSYMIVEWEECIVKKTSKLCELSSVVANWSLVTFSWELIDVPDV